MILALICNYNAIVALRNKTTKHQWRGFQKMNSSRSALKCGTGIIYLSLICHHNTDVFCFLEYLHSKSNWAVLIHQCHLLTYSWRCSLMSETKMLSNWNITMIYSRPHNMFPKVFPLNPGPEKHIKWPSDYQNRFAEGDTFLRPCGFGGHLGYHLGFWKMHTFKLTLPSKSCLLFIQLLLQVKPGSFYPLMLSLTFSWKLSQASNTKIV